MTEQLSIRFLIPRTIEINANRHRTRKDTIPLVRQLRSHAAYAKINHARYARMERARCLAMIEFRADTVERDAANWQPTFKACIDGMIKGPSGVDHDWPWRILDNDDNRHLQGPDPRAGIDPSLPPGRSALTFTFIPMEAL